MEMAWKPKMEKTKVNKLKNGKKLRKIIELAMNMILNKSINNLIF